MWESMRFYHMAHSMKRIEIPLSHIRDKNKFKSWDFLFPLIQCFKTNFYYFFLFNGLRLLFISFGSMFQDFPSLTHTKNSLHFHSSFSLLLLYIHMSIAFHIILSQIHLDKKWCHLASTFQWHLPNSNVAVSFDRNPYE